MATLVTLATLATLATLCLLFIFEPLFRFDRHVRSHVGGGAESPLVGGHVRSGSEEAQLEDDQESIRVLLLLLRPGLLAEHDG